MSLNLWDYAPEDLEVTVSELLIATAASSDALIADDSINERQKQMLLEIYESFRKENTIESTGKE